ncbi:hypothetical protein BK140_10515 [Paenibacillus macerans]|jgi:hypothetical protein|nr:hypothetical protein BK140_10515 [Paenibacillus macerans]
MIEMMEQLLIMFWGLLSFFLGFRFFTVAMDDLGETVRGRVSGVLAFGFFIMMIVTKFLVG